MSYALPGGTPGGSNKEVQFNNSGALAGAAGFEYQAASPTLQLTPPANTYSGFVVSEIGSTPPALVDGYPMLLNLHTLNENTYSQLAFTTNAIDYAWSVNNSDSGVFGISGIDTGASGLGRMTANFYPDTASGQFNIYPQGVGFFSVSPTYYGGIAEVGADVFGLMLTISTPTSGALFPLTWSISGVQLQPVSASAGGTNELRFLELVANGANYVGFKAPDLIAGNVIWTLPSADGSSNQVLQTNGSGVLSWGTPAGMAIGGTVTSGTTGSLLFVGSGPVLAQDNANLFWDDTNNRLGIGTTTPAAPLQIGTTSTGEKLLVYNDGSGNRWGFGIQTGYMQLIGGTIQVGGGNAGSFTAYATFTSSGLFVGGGASSADAQLQSHPVGANVVGLLVRGNDSATADPFQVKDKVGVNSWVRQRVDTNYNWINQTRNGAQNLFGTVEEDRTLSTSGPTTDSLIDLPANSIILAVTTRVTSTINGVDSTLLEVGDPTTAARFGSSATYTVNSTIVGMNQMQGGISTNAAGPVQTSAAKVRLTFSGGADNTPSSGSVRITIHYIQLVAPTS